MSEHNDLQTIVEAIRTRAVEEPTMTRQPEVAAPTASPFTRLKRWMARLVRGALHRNRDVIFSAVPSLEELVSARYQFDQRLNALELRAAATDAALDEVAVETSERLEDMAELVNSVRKLVERAVDNPVATHDVDEDELYEELQETFRGTSEEVTDRLRIYLQPVMTVEVADDLPVLDLGPGRGEWLRLLQDNDIPARGIDLNARFTQRLRADGFDVVTGEAVGYLSSLEPESVRAVTGFHFAEHVPFDALVEVIDSSLRALQPGGCLILETPNPTNVVVGAASFYIDPTHRAPLHPQLLEFLLRARGFDEVELRFLQRDEDGRRMASQFIENRAPEATQLLERVTWALFGPEDYATIAWKSAGTSA